jgi:adenine-specific DNA-methyltransferase
VIKYLGSKRTILPTLLATIAQIPGVASVFDVFSGTARVGRALKGRGYGVVANDANTYAHTLAHCYVATEARAVAQQASALIEELNALPGRPGYITETYCERSRFFQPHNGERIDAMRERIETWALPDDLRAVLLTALLEAADRVDSTTGLQMAYLKRWAPRSFQPIQLRLPELLDSAPGRGCRALGLEARQAAPLVKADCAYLDPPYNQHSYLGNYHIWETLVRWDQPEVYGVACKRIDCRSRKSAFNSKVSAWQAFQDLVAQLRTPNLVVSFNNEGFIERRAIETVLGSYGHLQTLTIDYRRYVGAKIGIHDPGGRRVGQVSHLRNTEYLFVVSREPLPPLAAGTLDAVGPGRGDQAR